MFLLPQILCYLTDNQGVLCMKNVVFICLIMSVMLLITNGCSHNANYYMDKASFNYMRKEYDKSIVNLNKALKLEPENPAIYTHLGNVYIRKKEYNKAIENLNKALEINHRYFDAIMTLGLLYLEIDEPALSSEYIEKARKLKPGKSKDIDEILEKLEKQLAKEKQAFLQERKK